jgi:CelD/BcsL family acetyltransferase involved in cellulose biosynthesis
MRRMRRQFVAAGGTSRLSTAATLRSDVEAFRRLHLARWEGRGVSSMLEYGDALAPMTEDTAAELLPLGRFRLRMLEVAGEAVSAQLFTTAGGEVMYVNGGWDEAFARLRPPMLAILDEIEAAFDRGERRLDLGPGEQPYKLRFADGNDPVAWTVLLVPGRRMAQTAARTAPLLSWMLVREGLRRALSDEQRERLRAVRARLRAQRLASTAARNVAHGAVHAATSRASRDSASQPASASQPQCSTTGTQTAAPSEASRRTAGSTSDARP